MRRYKLSLRSEHGTMRTAAISARNGEWVRFADAEKLETEVARLTHAVELLERAARSYKNMADERYAEIERQ